MILHAQSLAMRLIAACLLLLTVAACGTKGALYLPPPESADGAATKQKR
jgi:predicted small lipoprotein YifL